MLLVILGTQDKPFTRLLKALDEQVEAGLIKETDIVVQSGCTKLETQRLKLFDLLPIDEFDRLIDEADLVITHAGVGSILSALKKGKKVIACARLAKYGEHTNDHQLQILEAFAQSGYLLPCTELDKLYEVVAQSKEFVPQPYVSTTKQVVKEIRSFIQSH